MILLDTNVISEPIRHEPDERVIEWINAQPMETLFLSSITVAELRWGIELLPAGRRRTTLRDNLERRVLPLFSGRVLSFDLSCTPDYAKLMCVTRKAGISVGMADGCIAAIASANRLTVASRDIKPFKAAGLEVINPWRA